MLSNGSSHDAKHTHTQAHQQHSRLARCHMLHNCWCAQAAGIMLSDDSGGGESDGGSSGDDDARATANRRKVRRCVWACDDCA